MRLIFVTLFIWNLSFAQWTPSNPLINAPADCPIAYRICDAAQTYNFALIDDGAIDDAHGSLGIPGLNRSSPTQFESKSAFIIFTPQYSGQFGLSICPETVEDLAFLLLLNPNCGDLETGNYSIVTQGGYLSDISNGCTGLGYNPITGLQGGDWSNYVNVIADNTYMLFVSLETINQPGTHRFTLSFQGSVVTAHPDLFNYPGCTMSLNEFALKDKVKVFPNPFHEVLQIESGVSFKTMALYDLLGKQIISQTFAKELNTSNLARGMYLLRLYTEDGEVVVKKVVKE
jgi:hypothetical protein